MKFRPFNPDRIKPLSTIKIREPKVEKIKRSLPPKVIEWWQLLVIYIGGFIERKSREYAEIGFKVFFSQYKLFIYLTVLLTVGVILWTLLKW